MRDFLLGLWVVGRILVPIGVVLWLLISLPMWLFGEETGELILGAAVLGPMALCGLGFLLWLVREAGRDHRRQRRNRGQR